MVKYIVIRKEENEWFRMKNYVKEKIKNVLRLPITIRI
jgi:hypothetical protein